MPRPSARHRARDRPRRPSWRSRPRPPRDRSERRSAARAAAARRDRRVVGVSPRSRRPGRVARRRRGIARTAAPRPRAAAPELARARRRTSPARAPDRAAPAPRPSSTPSAVTAMVSVSRDGEVAALDRAARRELVARRAEPVGDVPDERQPRLGAACASATSSAVGRAPIAAMSARLTAAAFQPRSNPLDQASRKSGPVRRACRRSRRRGRPARRARRRRPPGRRARRGPTRSRMRARISPSRQLAHSGSAPACRSSSGSTVAWRGAPPRVRSPPRSSRSSLAALAARRLRHDGRASTRRRERERSRVRRRVGAASRTQLAGRAAPLDRRAGHRRLGRPDARPAHLRRRAARPVDAPLPDGRRRSTGSSTTPRRRATGSRASGGRRPSRCTSTTRRSRAQTCSTAVAIVSRLPADGSVCTERATRPTARRFRPRARAPCRRARRSARHSVIPDAIQHFGNIEIGVKPGIVLSSLTYELRRR